MTLRLNEEEHAALRDRAAAEGISMQEAARKAVREYVLRMAHDTRVDNASERVRAAQMEALSGIKG